MKGFLVIAIIGLTVTFITADPDCRPFDDGYALPHPRNCENFFVCKDHLAVAKKCPTGLHFNPNDLYCQLPELAGCKDGPGPGPGPGPTTPHTPTTPGTGGVDPKICRGQPLGKKIPYPRDCTRFINCVGGPKPENCPPTLHFNPVKEVCDWPERAGCTQ